VIFCITCSYRQAPWLLGLIDIHRT